MDLLAQAWESFEGNDYAGAEMSFLKLLNSPDSSAEQQRQASYGLGYVFAFSGRFDQAREIFENFYRDATANNDVRAAHRAIHQIGMVERMAGNWLTARMRFESEYEMIQQLERDDLAVAINSYEQGLVALHLNELEVSKSWFDRSLTSSLRCGDRIAVACAYRGLGDWHQRRGDLDAAAQSWNSSRSAFLEASDTKGAEEIDERLVDIAKPTAPLLSGQL